MAWVLNDPPPKYGAELAECKRYYQCLNGYYGVGAVDNAGVNVGINLPVSMRITPTFAQEEINAQINDINNSGYYKNVQLRFRWGSADSLTLVMPNPDPAKFVTGHPLSVRLDGLLYFNAGL